MAYYSGKKGNYQIKSGDTLSAIASRTNTSVNDLVKWNNISDANKIRAGAKLYTTNPTSGSNKTVNTNKSDVVGLDNKATTPQATDNMKNRGVEFDWEKEGRIQGGLETTIQSEQARREALEKKQEINYDAVRNAHGRGEIEAAQTQNKMGITGDAAADMDRNVTVANNARALELYSNEEMIREGFDMGVKIAKMFGDLKERQVTIEEYNRAWDRANEQATITGVFFDPVQMQLLGQGTMAEATINNPYAAPEEKSRARSILKGVNDGFLEMGVSRKGRDTLAKIFNTEQLRLQAASNDIQRRSNNIQARAVADGALQYRSEILKTFNTGMTPDEVFKKLKSATKDNPLLTKAEAWATYSSSRPDNDVNTYKSLPKSNTSSDSDIIGRLNKARSLVPGFN